MSTRGVWLTSLLMIASFVAAMPPVAASETQSCTYTIATACEFQVRADQTVVVSVEDDLFESAPIQFCNADFTECVSGCGSLAVSGVDGTIFVGDFIATMDLALSTGELCPAVAGTATAVYS